MSIAMSIYLVSAILFLIGAGYEVFVGEGLNRYGYTSRGDLIIAIILAFIPFVNTILCVVLAASILLSPYNRISEWLNEPPKWLK